MMQFVLNSLLKKKFWTSQKCICRRHNKCDSKIEICYGMGREKISKRRNYWLSSFSSFPKFFSTASFFRVVNSFPNKPWILLVCCTRLLKTRWGKEKLLVTSNFSFSRSVFYLFESFLPFSLNLKLSSANSFNLTL